MLNEPFKFVLKKGGIRDGFDTTDYGTQKSVTDKSKVLEKFYEFSLNAIS